MKNKIILIVGILIFITSIYPIYLMMYELISETYVSNKFTVKPIEFNEDTELETIDIHSFYLVEGTPPFEKINEVGASHFFLTKENENIDILTYNDLVEGFNNKEYEYYYRTYHLYNQEVRLVENIHDSKDIKLYVNEKKIKLDSNIQVNDNNFLYNRYENIGFVYAKKNNENEGEFIIVEQKGNQNWNIYTLKESGLFDSNLNVEKENLNENKFLVKVIYTSSVAEIGYKSSIMFSYPMFYFPILYPFITILLSIILIIYAFYSMRSK